MNEILTKFFKWCDAKSEVLQNKEEIVLAKIDAQKEEEALLKEYTNNVERCLSSCVQQREFFEEEIERLNGKVTKDLESSQELTPELSDSLYQLKINQNKLETKQKQIQEFSDILESVKKKALHLKHSTDNLKDMYAKIPTEYAPINDSWSQEEALNELQKFLVKKSNLSKE